jgi:hypothetical protein
MALMSALLGQLRPSRGRAAYGRKAGRVILHGESGRAYAFEVYQAGGAIDDVAAVYVYARSRSPVTGQVTDQATDQAKEAVRGFDVGFVGRTEAMGRRAQEHERLGHFVGHGFDTLLILRVAHATIRTAIADDMIARHRPVLNELLRSYQGGVVS